MTDHHHHGHGTADAAPSDAEMAELLDLEAEALHGYWSQALDLVQQAAAGIDCRRVVDLGAGTGTGTVALARRFPAAEVVGVDSSVEMLDRVAAKAGTLGLAGRVRLVNADLDAGWPDVGDVDVAWASTSLHHLAEPDRVLGELFAAMRPRGVAAVAEMSEHLRFLPDDIGIGRPGLEARLLDALRAEQHHSLPELGSDWTPRLAAAGFDVLDEHTLTIELAPPVEPAAVRYARLWLQRMRDRFAEGLARDDLETLAALLDSAGPESLANRHDLRVRGTRTVTLARRL